MTLIPTGKILKHSGKGKLPDKFEYRAYEDKTLCVIACLKEYISRCNKHERLTTIVTLRKPFKTASLDKIRRLIKDVFIVNNTVNFSPHSCRAASSNKAKCIDVNIDEIIRKGCWKNWKSLFKYYDSEVTKYAPDDIDFHRICRVNNV